MGCSQSLISEENLRNRKITRELKKDYAKYSKIAKLLLLGAGESGKSTIVKQMKLLHPVDERKEPGFSTDEKDEAKLAIYANIIDSIVALLEATTGTVKSWNNQAWKLLYQINVPVRLQYFETKTLIDVLWLFLSSENDFDWLTWYLALCAK